MIATDEFAEQLLQACTGARLHVFVNAGLLNHIATDCILQTIPPTDPAWIIDVNAHGTFQHHGRYFRAGLGAGSRFATALAYRRLYSVLRNLERRGAPLSVYVPHVFHSVANHLALYAGADRVFLLPDGLLNYYDARINGAPQYARMFVKALLARVLGGKYRLYRGELIARNLVNYTGCHVFSAQGLTTAVGSVELLRYEAPAFEPVPGRSLFLDQPAELLSVSARRKLANDLHAALRNEPDIRYKPHPTQRRCSIAEGDSLPITPVESKLPAEKIVAELRPEKVYGIYSSALITLKLLYPDLAVYSVGTRHFIAHNRRLAQAQEAMSRLGIRIL